MSDFYDEPEFDLDGLLYDLISDEFIVFDSTTFEYTFANRLTARWWSLTRGKR